MSFEMTGALEGALGDVARAALANRPGSVDLSAFSRELCEDNAEAIVTVLDVVVAEVSVGAVRAVVGDSRLYSRRLGGNGTYFVLVPADSLGEPLRPEFRPNAKLWCAAGTEYGLYDFDGPGTQAQVAMKSPGGLPADYVLPWSRNKATA